MKRLFWLSVGAGAGVYATHRVKKKVERVVEAWSPEGVAARAVTAGQTTGQRLKLFATDVRTEMRAREQELREAVQMDQAPPEPPDGPRPRRVLKARYTIIDDDKDGH
ncbi:hypothetical protein GCM10009678_77160 [Actinomadura kijaniata]|uniref:Secreted protein n=1 Tax=Actinomadura namibiensis TaxID=182080 RepID=A0A7W3QR40_ACTNM|nr:MULTISPECIES: hypothetical protein [Actinomadura]MBA8956276.1 hypothetical protein [Actinomadura namibiensis]